MKPIIPKTMALVALAAILFSFTNLGGEGYEIYLDNKIVIQQYGKTLDAVNNLRLDHSALNGRLTVKYHHCGRVGKNRTITIKDGQNKALKEWRYPDVAQPVAAMNCKVKDILDITKNTGTLKLYYTSSELPNGRLLTNIVVENKSVVSVK